MGFEVEEKILDGYRNSRTLQGLCYLYSQDRTKISFTGFGKGLSAKITYVNNENHLEQLLKGGQYDFIILNSANGQSDYTRLFGYLCSYFEKKNIRQKNSFPVSVIDEENQIRRGLLCLGDSYGLKIVFGTRKDSTINTNLAEILAKN